MELYRKTRQSLFYTLIKLFIKILIAVVIFIAIIFFINQLDLPKPTNKIIKQEIPNEKFKVIK